MKKSIIFLLIFLNVFAFCSVFKYASAKTISIMQDSTQFNSFTYDINTPFVNGSYANRIAFENYEYESGTNLSSRYSSSFNCIVTQFNDIDFASTNNTYISKGLLATKIGSSNYLSRLFTFTNTIDFASIRNAIIIEKKNCQSVQFRFYYSATKYFNIYLNFATRALQFQNESGTIFSSSSFVPVTSSYTNIYFAFERGYTYTDFYLRFSQICYNKTNARIISQNNVDVNLNYTQNYKILSSTTYYQFASISDSLLIISEDNNYLTNKYITTQRAKINSDYKTNSIRLFYLTNVAYYQSKFNNKGLSQKWIYATTLREGRYLNYKTNATIYSSLTNSLLDTIFENTMRNSFSLKFELGMNSSLSDTSDLYFMFNRTTVRLRTTYVLSKFYISLVISDNLNTNIIFNLGISTIYDNRLIYYSQFKNKFLYSTLIVNNTIFTFKNYINDIYANLSIDNYYILNDEIKSLSDSSITSLTNKTIDITNDIFTFTNRVNQISTYYQFSSKIYIPPSITQQIKDQNDRLYYLQSANIIYMKFGFKRSSANGQFSITSDNDINLNIFYNSTDILDTIDYNFLNQENFGNIYINSIFTYSSVNQLTINITTYVIRSFIFTDRIPENNLLIQKALEIFIPIMLFGMIIIGFKSNSDSKFLGFIGMYIGILTLYLMEYMSLLFMLLCMIIQSLALYFIVKHEKEGQI